MAGVAAAGAGAPATAPPASVGRAARTGGRLPALLVGLCAAGPVIASTARAIADGWVPAGDQANIAVRAHDVLGPRTPLLGLHSDVSELIHHSVYSLGPMLFWLLALPVRVSGSWSLALTMGVLNTACVVGSVVLARRRGGAPLMLLFALALVLMQRSLPTEALHDVWNPSAGLFPFTLLLFLAWGLACGEHRLLPAAVLALSFASQAQLTYALPSLAIFAVGIAGLAVSLRRPREGRVWPWVLAAVVVAGACWAPPLIDELEGNPGNITELLRAERANHSTLGEPAGRNAVILAVGVMPWWTSDPSSPWEHKREVLASPGGTKRLSTLLVLLGLVAMVAVGLAAREARTWSAGLIGLALCACIGAVAASTPTLPVLAATLGYTLWWASPAGMFVWVVLAWSALRLLASLPAVRRLSARYPGARSRSLLAAGAGACIAVTALAAAVATGERPDEHLQEYAPVSALNRVLQRLPAHSTVLLTGALGDSTFRFKMAARLALVRHGVHPVSPGTDTRLGQWYDLDHRRYRCTVYVQDGVSAPVRGAGRLAALDYAGKPIGVWVYPAGCPAFSAGPRASA